MENEEYTKGIIKWREEVDNNLRRENGWLALARLFLRKGTNDVGSAPNSDILLPSRAPAKLGTFVFDGDSVILNVELDKTTTTITTDSPDPSVPGQSVTIGFSVAANGHDQLIPTGSVTVNDGEGKTCTGQLDAAGEGSCSIVWTTSGSRNLTATYAGSGIFASSTSAAVSHMVAKADQKITFAFIKNKIYGAAPFEATATGGGSGNPVTFAVVSGPATATGTNGSTITITGAGSVTVRASQAGNDDYNAAPDVDRTFTVNKANQMITVTSSAPVSASYNSSFTVSATARSGLAVVISTSGACSGSGEGSATVTMTSDSGTCTVSYNQPGDTNYNAAPEVTQITNTKMAGPAAPVSLSVKDQRNRLMCRKN